MIDNFHLPEAALSVIDAGVDGHAADQQEAWALGASNTDTTPFDNVMFEGMGLPTMTPLQMYVGATLVTLMHTMNMQALTSHAQSLCQQHVVSVNFSKRNQNGSLSHCHIVAVSCFMQWLVYSSRDGCQR